MKKLMIIGLTIALAIGVAGAVAFAAGNNPGYFKNLNLTGDQQATIDQLRQEHQDEMAPLRGEVLTLRDEYRQAVRDGDQDQAAAIRDEMDAVHEQQAALRDEHRDEVRAVLTDEQNAQLGQQYMNQDCPMAGSGSQARNGHHDGAGPHGTGMGMGSGHNSGGPGHHGK